MNDIVYIRKHLSMTAQYMQLAEEAAELSAAASKMARILGGENPSPVTPNNAHGHVIEELTDVLICAGIIGLEKNDEQTEFKLKRWAGRLRSDR